MEKKPYKGPNIGSLNLRNELNREMGRQGIRHMAAVLEAYGLALVCESRFSHLRAEARS